MKPKNTFVVEVKKTRRLDGTRTKRSLWAGIDLAGAEHQDDGGACEPAFGRSNDPSDDRQAADREPARLAPPRILPVIVEPAMPEIRTAPAGKNEPPADEQDRSESGRRPRYSRRRPRLRLARQAPLPAGQRWKQRLPRILWKLN